MKNDGKGKVYCFSEGEFSILADVCGIQTLLCFSAAGGNELKKLTRGEYAKTVYELSKRNIIIREEEELVLDESIAGMILLCKNCDHILGFCNAEGKGYKACIYLTRSGVFTLVLPGSRKGEYIRMSSHDKDELELLAEDYMQENEELRIFSGSNMMQEGIIRKAPDKIDLKDILGKYLNAGG